MLSHQNLQFEIKLLGPRKFEGYGSVFGNVDGGADVVLPGAFGKALAMHKSAGTQPLMFWMHQPDQVPGVWLSMGEDRKGLAVEGELVDTALGRDVRVLLEKKAVHGLSIGYRVSPGDVEWRDDGVRVIKQVSELAEVSIVSMAMNPLARVSSMKAARLSDDGEYVPTPRELEQQFRSLGCSKGVARALIARLFDGPDAGGMPGGHRWDAGGAEDEELKQLAELAASLTDKVGAAALSRI